MNRLLGHSTYLAGPIDHAHDLGIGWRKELTPWLQTRGIGVLDPCDKPSDFGSETPETFHAIRKSKEDGDFDTTSSMMNPIFSIDLHLVDLSNFVILYIDNKIHMCGSYLEAAHAALGKKPVIVCCEQGKIGVPNSLFGIGLRHKMFFSSWDEVKAYIDHIAFDETIDTLGKWRFIDYNKVFGINSENPRLVQRA